MKSSNPHLSRRRRTYVRLLGEIQNALNQALDEERQKRGLTRAEIGRVLGRNKSFVTRKLAGADNMTLQTLADFAYALDRPVKVTMPPRTARSGSNHAPSGTETSAQDKNSREKNSLTETDNNISVAA